MLSLWFPFIKDITQQGLSSASITAVGSGVSLNDNGKLGKCYYFDGTGNGYMTTDFPTNIGTADFSISVWVKIPTITSGTYFAICTSKKGLAASAGFGIYWNYAQKKFLWSTADGSAGTEIWMANTVDTIVYDKWIHLVMVRNSSDSKVGYFYINGERYELASVPAIRNIATATNLNIGKTTDGYYPCKMYMNDLRVYINHALSAKEIKELSKGLVCHYTLGDSYLEGTTNLCTTSDCLSSTCYNGATGKYGYGTNTDIYKTTGIFNGKLCTKVYMGTSGNSARPYPYVSNMFVSNGTNQPKNKTISFDYYGTIGTYINPYKLGSGSATCDWRNNATATKSGTFTNSGAIPVVPNMWNHISFTLTGTTDANAEWGYIILGDTHTSDTSNYWLFANFQIEAKDHETGYAGVGGTRNDTTVYDSSGYNYHGTPVGGLTVSTNTARNTLSTKFVNGSYIQWANISPTGYANTYTFAWWGKFTIANETMQWGFANGNRLNLYMYNTNCYWNTGNGQHNPFNVALSDYGDNNWHHFAITGDGTTSKLYLDGEYKGSAKTYVGITGTTLIFNGWDTGNSYNFNGSLSDFRLYSTALSAEDIQQLYNAPVSVTNTGAMMTQGEFVEVVT